MNDKKQRNLIVILVAILIVMVCGTTYAIWSYANTTNANIISTGQVIMSYSEKNEMNLEEALPTTDADGKLQQVYFDFSVSSYAKTNADDTKGRTLDYDIILSPIEVASSYTALNDSQIKVYLTKLNSNNTETEVLAPTTIDKLNNYLLKNQEEVFKRNSSAVLTNYRLRAWIDDSVNADSLNNAVYSYKFRVNVASEN